MKNSIKLILLVIVAGLSLGQMKANGLFHNPNSEPSHVDTEKTIRNYFKFPQILIPIKESKKVSENKVEVLFTTDKSGKVNFVLAKTDNDELKKEIEKQFFELHLDQMKSEVVHKVVLNFKTI